MLLTALQKNEESMPRSSRQAEWRKCSDLDSVSLTELNQFGVAEERMYFNLVQTNHTHYNKLILQH